MQAIVDTIVQFFFDIIEFIQDLLISLFVGILDGIAFVINAIPVPDFLATYSLGNMFNALHPDLLFFISVTGIPEATAILGLGVSFRLLRKALTLFQW